METNNNIQQNEKPKKNNIKEKNKNQKSKIIEEEDIKILRRKNMPKIRNFLEEFIQKNKRSNSMIDLRPHSQTIASATTCEDSENNDDNNLNINQLMNTNDNKKSKNKKQNNILLDDILKNDNNKKEENDFKRNIGRSMTITLLREMTPVYKEEEELEGLNTIYKEPQKKLSFILVDILLKKIIFENFMSNNILLIYHFCQQCFCFVNKEVFFRKLFHCYKFYKNKNLSLENLKNLIEFTNILVVENFEYYQKVNYNEVYMNLIKKFYFELINDLIVNFNEGENNTIKDGEKSEENVNQIIENENDKKEFRFESIDLYDNKKVDKDINYCDIKYVFNKKNLLKLNLNTENKNINIFIFKEKNTEKKK